MIGRGPLKRVPNDPDYLKGMGYTLEHQPGWKPQSLLPEQPQVNPPLIGGNTLNYTK